MAAASVAAAKRAMRASIEGVLAGLTSEHISTSSQKAVKLLLALPEVQAATRLTAFACMPAEVQTDALIGALTEAGKTVLLPRVIGRRKLVFRELQGSADAAMADLQTSKWGIREPVLPSDAPPGLGACQVRSTDQPVHVIIVPCVAFGEDCRRLGHGGGFYGVCLAAHRLLRRPSPHPHACLRTDTFIKDTKEVYAEKGWAQPFLVVRAAAPLLWRLTLTRRHATPLTHRAFV